MAYIGNTVGERFVASQPASVYSGDVSTTVFTLEHSVASDEDILVSVDGVVQEPSVAYAVSGGTTLTFTSAPSNNTGNNIFVYYLFRTVATVDHPSTSSLLATDGTFSGDLTVDTNTLYVDSANNRVGVGTASPSYILDIQGQNAGTDAILRVKTLGTQTYSDAYIYLETAGSGNTGIAFGDSADDNVGLINYDHSDNSLYIRTNATEAMRIDSSGNLLVGKTAIDSAASGVQIEASGTGVFGRSGSLALIANRNTNDGDIISFRKDGSSVGSIGVTNSIGIRKPYLVGAGGQGITFGSDSLLPATSAGAADTGNTMAIGQPSFKFSDLYLSGGVNIYNDATDAVDIRGTGSRCEIDNPANNSILLKTGGTTRVRIDANGLLFGSDTASANALDDYEEGTWTPTIGSGSSVFTYTNQVGVYTKIGRLVYATFDISYSSFTSPNGSATYIVLPAINSSSSGVYHIAQLRGARCTALTTAITAYDGSHAIIPGTNLFEINKNDGAGNSGTVSSNNGMNSSGRIVGSAIYSTS
jgi:hypothetical protein